MIVLKIIGFLLKIIGVLLLIILLILLAAMCVPVHLCVRYEPDVTVRIRVLFFRYTLVGEPEESGKPPGLFRRFFSAVGRVVALIFRGMKWIFSTVFNQLKTVLAWVRKKIRRKPKRRNHATQKPQKPAQKENGFFRTLFEQRGIVGAFRFFLDIGKALGGTMVRIYRGIKVDRLVLHVSVSGEDASDTAIQYGRICSAAFPALSFLLGHTRGYDPLNARTKDIEIVPDFAGEGIDIYLIAELTLFPILIVGNALSAVIRFVVAQIKITSKYKSKKNDKRKV